MRLWRLFKSQCYIQTSWVFNTTSLSILSLAHRGEIIGGQTLRAGQHVPLGGRNPGDKVCLPSLITCSWDFPSGRTGWFYLSPWRSRTCTPPMSGAGEACEGRWPKTQNNWKSSRTIRINPKELKIQWTIQMTIQWNTPAQSNPIKIQWNHPDRRCRPLLEELSCPWNCAKRCQI